MKHQTEQKAYTDEQIDQVLQKSMVEIPEKIEKSLEDAPEEEKAAIDAYFDESRKALLKERIDLEREKRRLAEEKAAAVKRRRIKVVAGIAAALAIIIAVPVTSQSARKFLDNLGLHIFSDVDRVMTEEGEGVEKIYNEKAAWDKAQEIFDAKKMVFKGYENEWLFERAEYHSTGKTIGLLYYLQGKFVIIKVKHLKDSEKTQYLIDGKLMEEYPFDGDEYSYVRLYEIEKPDRTKIGYAEIAYGQALYTMDSEIPYNDFEKLIKKISFDEE